jgi:hypothetical protein
MSDEENLGPPGRPGPTAETGPHQKPVDSTTDKRMICHAGVAQWPRRRDASRRLPVLDCRCRTADPWLCRCNASDLLSEHADAYLAAVKHLQHCGLLAAPNIPAMRELWRRSDDDRELMNEIAARWELAG